MFLLVREVSCKLALRPIVIKLLVEIGIGGLFYIALGYVILKAINPDLFKDVQLMLRKLMKHKTKKA